MNEALLNQNIGCADSPKSAYGASDAGPIRNLVAALKQRQVRYCHWKSNIRLGASLSGQEDLDLLVLRSDATQFFEALVGCGFKLARSRDIGGHPGVIHAFALDTSSLQLVHVHAYFQIVTGDSLVKSYHLPLENILLADPRELMDVLVPAAEAELVVFLLRVALKHSSLFETYMVNRHYSDIPLELAWLQDQADENAAKRIWKEFVPTARAGEFEDLVAAIRNPAHKMARIRIGVRLAWRLRDWRRLGYFAELVSRFRRIYMLVGSRLRKHKSVNLVSGGALIAMIGPKASGKSTLGAALADRLGKQLDVRRIHIGKPPATLVSAPVRLLLPMLRRLLPSERSGQYQKPERRVELVFSYAYVVRMVLLAYDRRALIFKSRRLATAGAVIITDRYPPSAIGAIDGRQFGEAAIAACRSRLKSALMRLEARLYDDLPKPDLVIRLSAPIQTTLLRDASRIKVDGPDPSSVLRRRDLESTVEIAGTPVLMLDTDVPIEQSVSEILTAVWERL
ncbi:hypothetical protein [Cypionkella sp.]|uniref:hypothetical protein n=1 Tax=Cypionkella sp. TaxID=2811411 RepID=UPI00262FD990|nr:hypothetical protein [Cypionkella sp.]MDB5664059.1 hypothetical protein [Cypionkella sp.]